MNDITVEKSSVLILVRLFTLIFLEMVTLDSIISVTW